MYKDLRHLDSNIKKHLELKQMAGASVKVALNNEVIFEKFYGYENIENNKLIDKNSLFRMASNTKPITATAVLICYEKGLLNISDPITKYLDGFEKMYINAGEPGKDVVRGEIANRVITIFDLLTHSSGYGETSEEWQVAHTPEKDRNTLEKSAKIYSKYVLAFQPGTKQAYAYLIGFDLLARIVEVVTKSSFEDFVRENIFNPLEMFDTSWHYSLERDNHKVITYWSADGKFVPDEHPERNFGSNDEDYVCGSAGLISTLDDYFKFQSMLTNFGEYNGVRILKSETVKMMSTPQLSMDVEGVTEDWNWGFGVYTRQRQIYAIQALPYGSFGWSGAYGTHAFSCPDIKLTVVYMHNSNDSGNLHWSRIERDIMKDLGYFDENGKKIK